MTISAHLPVCPPITPRRMRKLSFALACFASMALALFFPCLGESQAPRPLPRLSVIAQNFNPILGAGARYETHDEHGSGAFSVAVVGETQVNGRPGYWVETRVEKGDEAGLILKQLVVRDQGRPHTLRLIIQRPGRAPEEETLEGNQAAQPSPESREAIPSGIKESLGRADVTTPAGKFVCHHYRVQLGSAPGDLWTSRRVAPYGLVKLTSEGLSMEVVQLLDHQKSELKTTPHSTR
jgi:hypothetical protein